MDRADRPRRVRIAVRGLVSPALVGKLREAAALLLGLALVTPPATAGPEVRLVKDIVPGVKRSGVHYIVSLGDVLFFVAHDTKHGQELWKSDGTRRGTFMVMDIRPGPKDSLSQYSPGQPAAVGDLLYFSADDDTHGRELWKSDGTGTGTVMVKDIRPGRDSSLPDSLADVGALRCVIPSWFDVPAGRRVGSGLHGKEGSGVQSPLRLDGNPEPWGL